MSITTAVSPSQLTPGLYMTIDLLAGNSSPGTGVLRAAIIASKTSAGDLTNDTEVRAGQGPDSAAVAFGTGGPGHLAAKLAYAKYPAAQIDFISPVPGAVTATLDITTAGAVGTAGNVIDCDFMGRTFEIAWLSGESADAIKTKIINKVLSLTQDLMCTAVSGGTGVTRVNAKLTGNVGADIIVKAKLRNAQTGSETCTGAIVATNLVAASGTDPDLTNAMAALAGKEYAFILGCLSNADVAAISATNNIKRMRVHVDTYNSGLGAKLQQWIVGYTGASATGIASMADSDSGGNAEEGDFPLCENGRGLPCELGGRELGGCLLAYSNKPNANRIGELFDGYIGAADKIANMPSLSKSEAAIGGGVSLIGYTPDGAEIAIRPITTHSLDSVGGADRRLLDLQMVTATYIVARDLRSVLPIEFKGVSVVKNLEPGDDPLPSGIVEERDIQAFCLSRLRFWEREGVISRASVDAALANGTLIVQVNPSDATQVDIILPFKIVPPLAKMGVVVQRQPN